MRKPVVSVFTYCAVLLLSHCIPQTRVPTTPGFEARSARRATAPEPLKADPNSILLPPVAESPLTVPAEKEQPALDLLPSPAMSNAPIIPGPVSTPFDSFPNTGSRSGNVATIPTAPEPTPITPLWTFTPPENFRVEGGALTLQANGNVIVPDALGRVLSVGENGIQWQIDLGTPLHTPATLKDDIVYLAGKNGVVYALDSTSGQEVWSFTQRLPNQFNGGGFAVDEEHVYIGGSSEIFYALDRRTGAESWRFVSRAPIESAPVISEDRVYVLALDQTLYALDKTDGSYLWEFQTGDIIRHVGAALNERDDIIFGSDHSWIQSLDRSGLDVWSYVMDSGLSGSPVIDENGVVYAASRGGTIHAIDASGEGLWLQNTGSAIQSSPALDNLNQLYIGNDSGQIRAYDTQGSLLWLYQVPEAIQGKLVIDQQGKLFALTSSGRIIVIQTSATGPGTVWPMQQKNSSNTGEKQ